MIKLPKIKGVTLGKALNLAGKILPIPGGGLVDFDKAQSALTKKKTPPFVPSSDITGSNNMITPNNFNHQTGFINTARNWIRGNLFSGLSPENSKMAANAVLIASAIGAVWVILKNTNIRALRGIKRTLGIR